MTPALSHALLFDVPSPLIARCSRCGRLLKTLADVATPCQPKET